VKTLQVTDISLSVCGIFFQLHDYQQHYEFIMAYTTLLGDSQLHLVMNPSAQSNRHCWYFRNDTDTT